MKIRESIGSPTLNVGSSFGSVEVQISLSNLSTSQEYEMRLLALLLARNFASPCFGHEPKARVVTNNSIKDDNIALKIGGHMFGLLHLEKMSLNKRNT
jgi:hypothetical protein